MTTMAGTQSTAVEVLRAPATTTVSVPLLEAWVALEASLYVPVIGWVPVADPGG